MILVVTSSLDVEHTESVVRKLIESLGRDQVKVINVDVLVKERLIRVHCDDSRVKTFLGHEIDIEKVTAVWIRKIFWLGIEGESSDEVKTRNDIISVMTAMMKIWKRQNSRIMWISDPDTIDDASNKTYQLHCAVKAGLDVLPTNIALSAHRAESLLKRGGVHKIVHKRISGDNYLSKNGNYYEFPTRLMDQQFIEAHHRTLPLPFIFQKALIHKEEYRIFFVKENFFSTRTSVMKTKDASKAPVDWRLLSVRQTNKVLKTEKFELPKKLQQNLLGFMSYLKLSYGAIDMIRDPLTDIFYFLEVNPVGQWLYHERKYGLPISDAIAEELIVASRSA